MWPAVIHQDSWSREPPLLLTGRKLLRGLTLSRDSLYDWWKLHTVWCSQHKSVSQADWSALKPPERPLECLSSLRLSHHNLLSTYCHLTWRSPFTGCYQLCILIFSYLSEQRVWLLAGETDNKLSRATGSFKEKLGIRRKEGSRCDLCCGGRQQIRNEEVGEKGNEVMKERKDEREEPELDTD